MCSQCKHTNGLAVSTCTRCKKDKVKAIVDATGVSEALVVSIIATLEGYCSGL